MMGARRGKGSLQRSLDDTNENSFSNRIKKSSSSKSQRGAMNALNGGKGQEITGVTLPAPGTCIRACVRASLNRQYKFPDHVVALS